MAFVPDETDVTRTAFAAVYTPDNPSGVQAMGVLLSSGAYKEAGELRTVYAAGKVRLFGETLTDLSPATTKAQLVAAEVAYSGYVAGGVATTTWNPAMGAGNGAQTVSSVVAFAWDDPDPDPPVTDTVLGWWFEDSAGVARLAGNLPEGVPMIDVTSAIQLVLSDLLASAVG